MYDKIFEQAQTTIKPMSELMALNAKMFQQAAEKQSAFFKDIMTESAAYAKELGSQKDYSGIYQTQKAFMENMQEKWIAASTDAYESFTSSQEKVGDMLKKTTAM